MDYRRLIVILILVLLIAYMNRTMREGFDLPPCPSGQVRIGSTYAAPCGVPGSTLIGRYKGPPDPTCETGYRFDTRFGCVKGEGDSMVLDGKITCPPGSELLNGGNQCYQCPAGTTRVGMLCSPSASPSTTPAPTRTLADVRKDIDYLKSVGITETSENDTMKKLIAERASLGGAPPISTPAYSNRPSALANVPTPVLACAAENFSSF